MNLYRHYRSSPSRDHLKLFLRNAFNPKKWMKLYAAIISRKKKFSFQRHLCIRVDKEPSIDEMNQWNNVWQRHGNIWTHFLSIQIIYYYRIPSGQIKRADKFQCFIWILFLFESLRVYGFYIKTLHYIHLLRCIVLHLTLLIFV